MGELRMSIALKQGCGLTVGSWLSDGGRIPLPMASAHPIPGEAAPAPEGDRQVRQPGPEAGFMGLRIRRAHPDNAHKENGRGKVRIKGRTKPHLDAEGCRFLGKPPTGPKAV